MKEEWALSIHWSKMILVTGTDILLLFSIQMKDIIGFFQLSDAEQTEWKVRHRVSGPAMGRAALEHHVAPGKNISPEKPKGTNLSPKKPEPQSPTIYHPERKGVHIDMTNPGDEEDSEFKKY